MLSLSCEKKSTTGPIGVGSIVGQWKESNAVISLLLTTHSAQSAINFLNSTGEVAITGDYNKKLSLLIETPEDEDGNALLVAANPGGFLGLEDTSYIFGLDPTGADNQGALIVQVNDDTEYEDNLTGEVTYQYNGTTLNVTNSSLNSDDTQMNVNVSGNIAFPQVNIPANSPTLLSFKSDQFYEFGNTITEFFEDSSFVSSEDQGLSDSTGTWKVIGDTLKITTATEVEDPTSGDIVMVDTTVSLGYTNNGNQFTASQSFDICNSLSGEEEDDISCEEIFELIEQFFSIDEGSIKTAELSFTLIFERIPVTQVVKVSQSREKIKINSVPDNFVQFLINNRKLIQESR